MSAVSVLTQNTPIFNFNVKKKGEWWGILNDFQEPVLGTIWMCSRISFSSCIFCRDFKSNILWTYILLEIISIAVFPRNDFWWLILDECAYAAFVDAEEVLTWAGSIPDIDLKWAPDSIALICFTSGSYLRPQ